MEHKTVRIRRRVPWWAIAVVVVAIAAGAGAGTFFVRNGAPATPQEAYEQAIRSGGDGVLSLVSDATPPATEASGKVCRVNAVLRADEGTWKNVLNALRDAAEKYPRCMFALSSPGSDPSQPALLAAGEELVPFKKEQLDQVAIFMGRHTAQASIGSASGSKDPTAVSFAFSQTRVDSFDALTAEVRKIGDALPKGVPSTVWMTSIRVAQTTFPSVGSLSFSSKGVPGAEKDVETLSAVAKDVPGTGLSFTMSNADEGGLANIQAFALPDAPRDKADSATQADWISYDAAPAALKASADQGIAAIQQQKLETRYKVSVLGKPVPAAS